MSYEKQNNLYRDMAERGRMEFAARARALTVDFPQAGPEQDLAHGVAGGSMQDIDAVIAAMAVDLDGTPAPDDARLAEAALKVWPAVGAGRYPVADSPPEASLRAYVDARVAPLAELTADPPRTDAGSPTT